MPRSIALGLALLIGGTAQATTILSRTTDQLFAASDVVAVAHVQDIHVVQAGGSITTHVHLVLSESLKGPATGATVEVLVPGGEAGQWGQHVEGAPAVSAGEDCVVFLTRVVGQRFEFTGLEEGKLTIESNSSGALLHRTLTADFVERGPDGVLRPAAPLPETEPLEPYLDHLRELAGRTR